MTVKHNKQDLVDHVAATAGLSRGKAFEAIEMAIGFIRTATHDGGIQLHGLGTFSTVERAARSGRNPQTGEAIQIAAKTAVKFKPVRALVAAGA